MTPHLIDRKNSLDAAPLFCTNSLGIIILWTKALCETYGSRCCPESHHQSSSRKKWRNPFYFSSLNIPGFWKKNPPPHTHTHTSSAWEKRGRSYFRRDFPSFSLDQLAGGRTQAHYTRLPQCRSLSWLRKCEKKRSAEFWEGFKCTCTRVVIVSASTVRPCSGKNHTTSSNGAINIDFPPFQER